MNRLFGGLVALGLLVGGAGQGRAQPSYLYTTFDVPGSMLATSPRGINNSGQIVGNYLRLPGNHGFLLSGGSYTTFDVTGAFGTYPSGINDSGQIAGYYQDPGGASAPSHGFLLNAGTYTKLDAPGATSTFVYGD
jgi:hypothetical protein